MKAPVKPPQPYIPIEPPTQYDRQNYILISWNETLTMKELVKKLPKGITVNDLKFEHASSDHYNSESFTRIYYVTREPTPNYRSHMATYRREKKNYDKQMKLYDKAMEKYVKDAKVYQEWHDEQEVTQLRKRLAALEKKKQ